MLIKKVSDQTIDKLIQGINSIIKNRCSPLDDDVKLLNEVITVLRKMKHKRKRSDKDNLELIFKVVELLLKFSLIGGDVIKVAGIIR